jgi:Protein of unknown function (DUF2851)
VGPVKPEAELARQWAEATGVEAVDTDGQPFVVRFPGRRWGGPGPDFRGALLALGDGTLVRGDVEVHRYASGWADHGHAADPAYRSVVLHVVGRDDAPSHDGAGRRLRTLELAAGPLGRAPADERAGLLHPCLRSPAAVLAVVEAAGRARLALKAERLARALRRGQADQVLWRAVAEALGYTHNAAAFGRLAEAVPWARAARVAGERGESGVVALLLGSAGLLEAATLAEAHAWRALERSALGAGRPALSAGEWRLAGVRAANQPARRIRGLAALAMRWQPAAAAGRGPAASVLDAVDRAARQRGRGRPWLWELVAAPPWIGRGRAQVIVVNVLLPLALAAGVADAAALYARLPGEPPNRVTRYMAAQLAGMIQPADRGVGVGALAAGDTRFRGACRQQGLLHLFETTCRARRCEACAARARAR